MHYCIWLSFLIGLVVIGFALYRRQSESFQIHSEWCGPAYVISLPNSPKRANIAKHLRSFGIPFVFFDAIDGSRVTQSHRQSLLESASIKLDAKALGCALSHIALWKQCVAQNRPFLIFEDDVILNSKFRRDLEALRWRQFDIAYFGHCFEKTGPYIDKNFRKSVEPFCTHAYIITPHCAARFVAATVPMRMPIDNRMGEIIRNKKIVALSAYPPSATQPWQSNQRIAPLA